MAALVENDDKIMELRIAVGLGEYFNVQWLIWS